MSTLRSSVDPNFSMVMESNADVGAALSGFISFFFFLQIYFSLLNPVPLRNQPSQDRVKGECSQNHGTPFSGY